MSATGRWSLGVLAGGRSSRMGTDKAACRFRGTTLLRHAIARFSSRAAPVLVSVRPGGIAPPPGTTGVPDATPELGPLAGMAAMLARAPAGFLLVVPVDLPLFPARCGEALFEQLDGCDAAVLSWRGRSEPFPTLIATGLAPLLNDLLDRGLRRADSFHAHARCRNIPFEQAFPGSDPEAAFLNVNTPEDLVRAEALAASERS